MFGFFKKRKPVFIDGGGGFDLDVVGESNYQKSLKRICGGYKKDEGHRLKVLAFLHHEDDNEYDDQAVMVLINGSLVGYLSKKDARKYRRRLKKVGQQGIVISCNAIITGGWSRGFFDKGNFGVLLDLPLSKL